MLKEIPDHETCIHFCETIGWGGGERKKTEPQELGKRHGVKVQIHDIHPYLFVEATKTMIPITFCPFCGVDIDKEERP